jgi:hypothetical protein
MDIVRQEVKSCEIDCINYKHFAHMKGRIYENNLPRGTQVKKGREPII